MKIEDKTCVLEPEREQVLSARRPESPTTISRSPMAALVFTALGCSPVLLLEFEFEEALWGGMTSWTSAVCDLVAVGKI